MTICFPIKGIIFRKITFVVWYPLFHSFDLNQYWQFILYCYLFQVDLIILTIFVNFVLLLFESFCFNCLTLKNGDLLLQWALQKPLAKMAKMANQPLNTNNLSPLTPPPPSTTTRFFVHTKFYTQVLFNMFYGVKIMLLILCFKIVLL